MTTPIERLKDWAHSMREILNAGQRRALAAIIAGLENARPVAEGAGGVTDARQGGPTAQHRAQDDPAHDGDRIAGGERAGSGDSGDARSPSLCG